MEPHWIYRIFVGGSLFGFLGAALAFLGYSWGGLVFVVLGILGVISGFIVAIRLGRNR